jgi:hypothetical protein
MNPELAATLTSEAAQTAYVQGQANGVWKGVIYTLGALVGLFVMANLVTAPQQESAKNLMY